MFRTRKPTVARAKHDKPAHPQAADLQPYVPHAIVPTRAEEDEPPLKAFSAVVRGESLSDQGDGVAHGLAEQPGLRRNKPHPQRQSPTQPSDCVRNWEKKIEYNPFFPEDTEEELYCEVPPECRIEAGNDPLINHVLAMFPENEHTET